MVSGKNRTKATKRFLRLLLSALLLAAFASAASAATHTITKVRGTPIELPPDIAAGDTIVVTGGVLEPEMWLNDRLSPEGDFAVLRNCPVAFGLVLEQGDILSRAFYGCSNLTSVSLLAAKTILVNAFSGCNNLTSASMPVATSIASNAFSGCSKLTSVSLPAATNIGTFAFANCAALTSLSLPAAKDIGNDAFFGCTALTSVSLPVATSIGNEAFYGCGKLTSVSLPAATNIGDSAFSHCTSLTSFSLPSAATIGASAFKSCASLASISLPSVTTVGLDTFQGIAAQACAVLPADKPSGWDNSAFPDTAMFILPLNSSHWPPNSAMVVPVPEAIYAPASKPYVVWADKGPVTLEIGLSYITSSTAYQWYRDGEPISGAKDTTFDADQSGVYQISFQLLGDSAKTYRLPATRVVIGLPPAFEDGTAVEESFPKLPNSYALNRTFKATGTAPFIFDLVNPLPSAITATKAADSVTLAGTLPSSATTTYRFILTATNDAAFWVPGVKPAMLTYSANTTALSLPVNDVLGQLNTSPAFANVISVKTPLAFPDELTNEIAQYINLSGTSDNDINGSNVKLIDIVTIDSIKVIQTPGKGGSPGDVAPDHTVRQQHIAPTVSTGIVTGTTLIIDGFTPARGAADDVYILPLSITYFYNALSADLPDNWKTMTKAERAAWLTDDGSDKALAFAYEYVPKSGDAAQAPKNLIGPGGMMTWSDALSADIVTVAASGDLTVNYVPLTGTGAPFVVENWLVIPDGQPYPGYLTDPLWLLRVPASSGGGSGVGCGVGAGIFALFGLTVALMKKRL